MKSIYVYEHGTAEDPLQIGTLFADVVRGSETFSFEFRESWLKRPGLKFELDPGLPPYRGRLFPAGKPQFGVFGDATPDQWGRTLMDRRERLYADREGRKPRRLTESDYLLGVFDGLRMGALRFKDETDGPFLSDDAELSAPPWTTLRTLEEASRNLEDDRLFQNDIWLVQLFRPGSSLGGARPKASVLSPDGDLWIAKFPSRKDNYDVGAWEMVVHRLAKRCGLRVSEARLESFSGYGSTFLTKRFDREKERRIHFVSAMSALGKTDGDTERAGYLDIASYIRANGAEPATDLVELWKRIVFSMAVTNSDDHLRNHGFILTRKGWCLSPLYDVNPVPYGDSLSLDVDGVSSEISIDLAIESARYFGIARQDALQTAAYILGTVQGSWERIASECGIGRNGIVFMRPAFRICADWKSII